ncbi:Hypothetical_protein [Hexamita inflata]|uniref:Hypothetical_protein n=1 Tax=Hexamita inflata TaxID=28002 RepID=A0ABP1LVW9_9EUKA
MGSTQSKFFQFGGVLNQLNSTTVNLTDTMFHARQILKVYYMSNSGLIIGRTIQGDTLNIERLCVTQALKSYATFAYFGVIGFYEGTIQFSKCNIILNLMSSDTFSCFSTIGAIGTSISVFHSLKISVLTNTGGNYVSALVGKNSATNTIVTNCSVYSSSINAYQYVGGYFGFTQAVTFKFCQIKNANITAKSQVGGVIGYGSGSYIQISNCSVKFVVLKTNTVGSGMLGQIQIGATVHLANDQISSSTINCTVNAGGFIGFAEHSIIIIISEGVVNSLIIAATSSKAGGFIGTFGQTGYGGTLKIVTSMINGVKVISPSYAGIAVGCKYPTYSVSTSVLRGFNYVNNIKISNCQNFANSCAMT